MIVETVVRRIGNSQGITIPKTMCDAPGISVGSGVRIESDGRAMTVTPAKGYTTQSLMRVYDGPKPGEIDAPGKSVGRELW